MGSHIVTCHPTLQLNASRLYLPTSEGWKAELMVLVIYRDGITGRISGLARPSVCVSVMSNCIGNAVLVNCCLSKVVQRGSRVQMTV